MDPYNMNAMFGPWEDEIEEDENQRKLRKEYKYWRGQNFRMTAQCSIMIRQIKEMETELSAREAQKIEDLSINERLENMSRIAQNEFFEIAKQTMEEAAKVHQRVEDQSGQLSAYDQEQIDILTRLMEQQEKHMKMAITLEDALSPDTERRKRWEQMKDKERKVIETEAEITKKEVILAQIKKENDELKKQKLKRKNWMLKEIDVMDGKIKEQQQLQERREIALKEYDELQAELRFHRSEPTLHSTVSSESINLDDELPPPVVFKNPNDFPILRELFHKTSKDKSQKAKEKRAKKIQQKVKSIMKRVKSSVNIHGQNVSKADVEENYKILDAMKKKQQEKKQSQNVNEGASTSAAIIPEPPKVVEQPKIFKEPTPPVPMEVEPTPEPPKEVPQKKTTTKKGKLPMPAPSPVKTRSKLRKAKEDDTKKDEKKKPQASTSKSQEKKSHTEEAPQKPQEKKTRPEEAQKPQEKKVRIEEPPQKVEEKKEVPQKADVTPKEKNSNDNLSFEMEDVEDLFEMSGKMSPTQSDMDIFNDVVAGNSFTIGNNDEGEFAGFGGANFDETDPFGSGNNAAGNADGFFN